MNRNIPTTTDQKAERKTNRRVPNPIEIALAATAVFAVSMVAVDVLGSNETLDPAQMIVDQPRLGSNECELPVSIDVGGSSVTAQLIDNLYNS